MPYLTPTAVISVRWGNPYTAPPDGLPRILWQATVLAGESGDEIRRDHGPATVPGDGWAYAWTPFPKPVKRWSPERKAATRRARLRARLDKKTPLLADQLYEQEIARRPAYFDADAIAEADIERDAHRAEREDQADDA